jgi:hypothetical protein
MYEVMLDVNVLSVAVIDHVVRVVDGSLIIDNPEYGILLSSAVRVHSQMICHVARLSAMHSASIDDNATMGCFFNCQEIRPFAIWKM